MAYPNYAYSGYPAYYPQPVPDQLNGLKSLSGKPNQRRIQNNG